MGSYVDQPPSSADVLILGGGHAGLSGALTLYRQLHTCIIFDSGQPRNRWQTPTHATATWNEREAASMREASEQELRETGLVFFVHTTIVTIKQINSASFVLTDQEGEQWAGRKLLIALGNEHEFPKIPGYEENYASGIFHCLFTFGYEQRGKKSAGLIALDTLALPKHTAMVADDTHKFVERVVVYTNGQLSQLDDMEAALKPTGAVIDDRKIIRLDKGPEGGSQMQLTMEDGSLILEDFIVHQPRTVVSPWLLDQLQLQLDPRGDIATQWPFYQTSIPGVFAAGDCASPLKIIPNALLMGANAGAGIARELPRRALNQPIV